MYRLLLELWCGGSPQTGRVLFRMEHYVTSRRLVVALVIAVALTAATLAIVFVVVPYANSPAGCEALDRGDALNEVLEENHAPPLQHVEIEGFCDDETPFYGVTARVGLDVAAAGKNLESMGCRMTGRQPPPKSLDFDERASARWYCNLANAGPVLVSLDPEGALLSKQDYEGVRGFFAPLGTASD